MLSLDVDISLAESVEDEEALKWVMVEWMWRNVTRRVETVAGAVLIQSGATALTGQLVGWGWRPPTRIVVADDMEEELATVGDRIRLAAGMQRPAYINNPEELMDQSTSIFTASAGEALRVGTCRLREATQNVLCRPPRTFVTQPTHTFMEHPNNPFNQVSPTIPFIIPVIQPTPPGLAAVTEDHVPKVLQAGRGGRPGADDAAPGAVSSTAAGQGDGVPPGR